jgi:hypothetical protein
MMVTTMREVAAGFLQDNVKVSLSTLINAASWKFPSSPPLTEQPTRLEPWGSKGV